MLFNFFFCCFIWVIETLILSWFHVLVMNLLMDSCRRVLESNEISPLLGYWKLEKRENFMKFLIFLLKYSFCFACLIVLEGFKPFFCYFWFWAVNGLIHFCCCCWFRLDEANFSTPVWWCKLCFVWGLLIVRGYGVGIERSFGNFLRSSFSQWS